MIVMIAASYIIYDDKIVPLLQRLRRAGKKVIAIFCPCPLMRPLTPEHFQVFLLTNSMWEYTNRVMDFLVHGA